MLFFDQDVTLHRLGEAVLEATWQEFSDLARDQIAMTWVVYDPPFLVNTGEEILPETFWQRPIRGFSYRGTERIYPASIVKLFYLVAVHEWLAQGRIQPSLELNRAVRDMIVDSSNDATSLVMDILTETTSGPELPAAQFATWQEQRNQVNRYFQSRQWPEFGAINVNQKTWCDGPYGRERMFLGPELQNRNMLTTEATARLVHSIMGGIAVSAAASQAMMQLMARSLDPANLALDPENQVTGFLGGAFVGSEQWPIVKCWSKAGLTSQVRHDAAYIELPDRFPYLLVVFTEGKAHSGNEHLLPFLSQQVAAAMSRLSHES